MYRLIENFNILKEYHLLLILYKKSCKNITMLKSRIKNLYRYCQIYQLALTLLICNAKRNKNKFYITLLFTRRPRGVILHYCRNKKHNI